jgi:hypothetical protein
MSVGPTVETLLPHGAPFQVSLNHPVVYRKGEEAVRFRTFGTISVVAVMDGWDLCMSRHLREYSKDSIRSTRTHADHFDGLTKVTDASEPR